MLIQMFIGKALPYIKEKIYLIASNENAAVTYSKK